jgi:hypothetical protein
MSTSGGAIALLSLSPELVAVDIIFNTIKTSFVNDNGTAGEKSTMIKNPDLMISIALTSLSTELDYDPNILLSDAVVSAAQCLYPGPSLPIVLHQMVNMPLSRSTDHSRFVNGIVLDHGACHPDMPDVLPNCEIMTLNTSLEYEQTETQSGFFYATAEERGSSLCEGAGIPMAANLILPSGNSERACMNFTTVEQSFTFSRSEKEWRNPRRGSGILIGFYCPASWGLSIRPYIDSVITMVGSSTAVSVVALLSLAQVLK